jgi:hypothetical protein
MVGSAIDEMCPGFQVSAQPPAKKTADQIEKETMNNRKSAFVIRYAEFRCSA